MSYITTSSTAADADADAATGNSNGSSTSTRRKSPSPRHRFGNGRRVKSATIPTAAAAAVLLLTAMAVDAGGPPPAVAFTFSPPAGGGVMGRARGDFFYRAKKTRNRIPMSSSTTEMAASASSDDEEEPDEEEDDDDAVAAAAVRDNPNAFRFTNIPTDGSGLAADPRGRKMLDDGIVRSLFADDSPPSKRSLVIAGRGGGRGGGGVSSNALVDLHLAGYGTMKLSSPPERGPKNEGGGDGEQEEEEDEEVPCIFLTPEGGGGGGGRTAKVSAGGRKAEKFEAIAVPLSTQRLSRIRPLLEAARLNVPMSKTRCLALNPVITNRDGGLFDDLPWDEWSVVNPNDEGRSTDAAGNLVEKKFRKGKRDAFERFLGKDWPGRSFSVGNMALRALYALDGEVVDDGAVGGDDVADDEAATAVFTDDDGTAAGGTGTTVATFDSAAGRILARRVLELELREAESLLAEAERVRAVERNRARRSDDSSDDEEAEAEAKTEAEATLGEDDVAECRDRIEGVKSALAALELEEVESSSPPVPSASTSASTHTSSPGGGGEKTQPAAAEGTPPPSSLVKSILRNIADRSVYTFGTNRNNTAPYRGAYGYSPTLDSREDYDSVYPYTGPFDLLLELVRTQLRATVIGVVLEDATLLEGVELGGAVVLRREAPSSGSGGQTELFNGEKVDLPVEEVTEREVKTGDVRIVECYPEEAVGVALAVAAAVAASNGGEGAGGMVVGGTVSVERGLFEGLSVTCGATTAASASAVGEDELPTIEASGGETIVRGASVVPTSATEGAVGGGGGDGGSPSSSSPKTTASLFSFGDGAGGGGGGGTAMEMIDANAGGGAGKKRGGIVGAVPSVEAYDSLSVPDKARILLSVDSFRGRLPRPRVLRRSSSSGGGGSTGVTGTGTKPLDDLLIPYLDESVRRAILIREAERAGDEETAAALRRDKSDRQVAKERARALREEGVDEELVAAWEEEAEFRGDLRADVTQDVGSYSRFLDKDEWYERDRIATARRTKRSSFGTLLDGIE